MVQTIVIKKMRTERRILIQKLKNSTFSSPVKEIWSTK